MPWEKREPSENYFFNESSFKLPVLLLFTDTIIKEAEMCFVTVFLLCLFFVLVVCVSGLSSKFQFFLGQNTITLFYQAEI